MNSFKSVSHLFHNLISWLTVPKSSPEMNRRNFLNVQIDAVGVGLASAGNPFLPVFLTRLGASTFQVGLLTTMPALTGLILAIPLGQFLQSRRDIVPWFSMARLTVLSGYFLTGIVTLLMPDIYSITSILVIWAIVTVPQTILNIAFTVVMNSVAGPAGRYELMTHRWSILGVTNAVSAFIAGQALDRLVFPLNYQVVFIALSLGGLVSYYFSSHLVLPDRLKHEPKSTRSLKAQVSDYANLIWKEKPFIVFLGKRFVFLLGTVMVTPLLPIYYVRYLNASDSSISFINIAANVTVILGYFYWTYQSRARGNRLVLLATTFGVSLFPMLTAVTSSVWPIPFYSGLAGIFQAGLNLVLFDELMRRIPIEYSASFVAVAHGISYLSSVLGPLLGTALSDAIGINLALVMGGGVSLIGFGLFYLEGMRARKQASAAQ